MAVRKSDDDDYYRILGVTKDVTDDALKRAYKRQALRWHPDKNQHRPEQAVERFKKVSEAYQALSNKKSRAAYNARRRHSAPVKSGKEEVLFSKTYGWPGVNISFYWTGPPPKESDSNQPSPEAEAPQARTCEPEKTCPEDDSIMKNPLELFRDMFAMDITNAIDKKLDGFGRPAGTSIFESVFGSFNSFNSFESEEEQPVVESEPPTAHKPDVRRYEAAIPEPMSARKRMTLIQEEYLKGDLNEQEYQELMGVFNTA